MSVCIAFDTATAFAMSFGISKFALAQIEAKLVGEIVGRHGRSPNPALVRAIKKWPPIYTLKQLQEFLGTINYVRPHCGPEYARIADPLRPLLKPGGVFPPNERQNLALQELKDLVVEHHRLCVPELSKQRTHGYRGPPQREGLTRLVQTLPATQLEECVVNVTRTMVSCLLSCIAQRIWRTTRCTGIRTSRNFGGC